VIGSAFGSGPGIFLIIFVALPVWIWGLADAISRPGWAFDRARSSKALWILLQVLLGVILAIIYLISIRPRVRAMQEVPVGGSWGWADQKAIPPGWHPDPSGRHQFRYWDGTSWTTSVSDAGEITTDPAQ
jgi:hypothetical protein